MNIVVSLIMNVIEINTKYYSLSIVELLLRKPRCFNGP